MAIRKFKPVTPGTRNKAISAFDEITCTTPEKSLLRPLRGTGGRNNQGKMTMRYLGGGHKKMYRVIDFLRNKDNYTATVKTIEYDPNRTARIALVVYGDGEKRYIIAPNGLKVGQTIASGPGVAPEIGNALPLAEIPLGTLVHNIELRPGNGAAMARSAGAFAQLTAREGNHAILRLPSGPRQSRPSSLAGPPAAQPWCRDEPCGSPDGWWRRPRLRWTPAFPQGSPCKGLQDAQPEEDFQQVHHREKKEITE